MRGVQIWSVCLHQSLPYGTPQQAVFCMLMPASLWPASHFSALTDCIEGWGWVTGPRGRRHLKSPNLRELWAKSGRRRIAVRNCINPLISSVIFALFWPMCNPHCPDLGRAVLVWKQKAELSLGESTRAGHGAVTPGCLGWHPIIAHLPLETRCGCITSCPAQHISVGDWENTGWAPPVHRMGASHMLWFLCFRFLICSIVTPGTCLLRWIRFYSPSCKWFLASSGALWMGRELKAFGAQSSVLSTHCWACTYRSHRVCLQEPNSESYKKKSSAFFIFYFFHLSATALKKKSLKNQSSPWISWFVSSVLPELKSCFQ